MAAIAAVLLPAVVVPATARAQSDAAAAATKSAPAAPGTPASPKRPAQVSIDQATLLVRATLLTLNDANRSGNYTVLRDLAAPEFQAKNSAADLALVFTEMRQTNLNLFSVILLTPQLTAAPEVDTGGRLRLSGFVPSRPKQVKFDLVFEATAGQWKLLNIGISTPQVQPSQAQDQEPKQEPKSVPASKLPAKPQPTAKQKASTTPKPPVPMNVAKPLPAEGERR
ncbi:hypothetical protein [Bradyrhizobium cenepequi]